MSYIILLRFSIINACLSLVLFHVFLLIRFLSLSLVLSLSLSFFLSPLLQVLEALSDAVLLRLASLARLCVALLPPIECAAALGVAEALR